jgi:acyl-CoA synthetase (AMP-forming)/AMP-acid ligase II
VSAGPIVESFARQVANRGDAEALWSRAERLRLSFRELEDRVRHWERTIDVDPAAPVALATGNRASFFELFIALRRRSIPVVSLDHDAPRCDRLETCRKLGIPVLLDHDHDDGAADSDSESLEGGVAITRLTGVDIAAPPESTALVKLTSGQTGNPRGVCFSEASLHAGIRQIGEAMEIDADDRVLIAIPLSHSYGFDNGVLSLAVLGTPLVLQDDVLPRPLLDALKTTESTFFPSVPPLIRSLARCGWPPGLALRRVICAAGPLSDEDARLFRKRSGLAVHQFYGCTESGGICFERDPDSDDARDTVGTPLPGVDIELDDENRVAVRSAANFIARFERGATVETNVVYPGDAGAWTPEGRLRLTGRTADFLKIGGKKVHASEIEAALTRIEGVEAAAVVGVSDDVRGERTIGFVVTDGLEVKLGDVPRDIAPRELRIVDELPYTARGKLDRDELRRMAGA